MDFFIILPNFQRIFAKGGVFLTDQDYWKLALEPTCLGQNPVVKSVIVNQGPYGGLRAYLKAGEPHSEVHAIKMALAANQKARLFTLCSNHAVITGKLCHMQDYKFSLSHVHIIQSPEENVQNPHMSCLY